MHPPGINRKLSAGVVWAGVAGSSWAGLGDCCNVMERRHKKDRAERQRSICCRRQKQICGRINRRDRAKNKPLSMYGIQQIAPLADNMSARHSLFTKFSFLDLTSYAPSIYFGTRQARVLERFRISVRAEVKADSSTRVSRAGETAREPSLAPNDTATGVPVEALSPIPFS